MTGTVLKFSPMETFVKSFTGGGLASPMSIARNLNDELYVSGGASNNIVKFDNDGNFLKTITHPDLPAPQGIAFDEHGHFFPLPSVKMSWWNLMRTRIT
jgi:DNA-binding beta-propeller fold protein YncE